MTALIKNLADTGFGSRLRSFRKDGGWFQADFAKMCGVSPPTQSFYENSLRVPDVHYLRRVAMLGGNLNSLVTGVDASRNSISELQEVEVLTDVCDFEKEYGELNANDRIALIRWLKDKKATGRSHSLPELRLVVSK
jgi:transcriptional regulator with XRE-family HTH domain